MLSELCEFISQVLFIFDTGSKKEDDDESAD